MFSKWINAIEKRKRNIKWKKKNPHNTTTISGDFPIDNVRVGKRTYGKLNIVWMCKEAKIDIGSYCSIAEGVKFLVGGEHNYHRISTWPFQSKIYGEETFANINRDIVIEDDVWIGYEALIMSGVRIGKGSVVGARAIVSKDIPPYSIFVGNKVIKKRFDDEIINKISLVDYNSIEHSENDDYRKFCQVELKKENVDEVLEKFMK